MKNLTIRAVKPPSKENIKKYLYEHRVQLLQCTLALIIFLLAVYRLSDIGQPILFNDEIGYWSNSAFLMGDDWTSVTGRINYYSYGYSLMLIPLRLLDKLFYWGWGTLYRSAVVLNGLFLVMSYVIALRLTKRYLAGMHELIRTVACFAVCTYSSYIVYAHIAWTECTLFFFFWVFLYVMMCITDHPTVGNHIAFAVVSFYLYTVHQRALGIVVTAVLIVLYLRLIRRNRLREAAAFLGSMYLCGLLHAVIKGNLQQVNYLGGDPVGPDGLMQYAFTKTAGVILAAGIILLLFLYLVEKRKYGMLLAFLAAAVILTAGMLWYDSGADSRTGQDGGAAAESAYEDAQAGEAETASAEKPVERRISVNDFSGQWSVVRSIFTKDGLIRLGISIAGKWFYLASASGFVICWGIAGLFKNMFTLCGDTAAYLFRKHEVRGDRIWFLGMLLAWFSTFMISAVYKEGFYKNDDLFNGRYIEFTIGFLLLYSLNCLINDKKWVRRVLLVMVLYIAAGHLCQYAINELGRKEFELAHCVMFGRMIWNYEVPVGKVRVVEEYIFPLAIWFLLILKAARDRLPRAAVIRTVLALMIPVAAWSYLGRTIVDRYVVVRNEKQAEPLPQFSSWISILSRGSRYKVYYITDSANQRYAGALQYMLQDMPVTAAGLSEVSFTEDAFYVVRQTYEDTGAIADNCEVVMYSRGYMLLINNNQELMENWRPFIK